MRARNVKPGFLKNEDLADIGPYAQLLFVGLWQLADRDGKLEDRPRRIKAEIFPYYEPKPALETLLKHLQEKNFIIRYKVERVKIIQVVNFQKHQSPHHTEKKSMLPDPCDSPSINGEPTVNSPLYHGEYPPDSLNHELGIMNHEKSASGKPSAPSFFSCEFFEVDIPYRQKLLTEYPALTDEMLKREFSRMEDWLSDNRKKKKFRANGKLSNPKLFLKNWLDKTEIKPEAEKTCVHGFIPKECWICKDHIKSVPSLKKTLTPIT